MEWLATRLRNCYSFTLIFIVVMLRRMKCLIMRNAAEAVCWGLIVQRGVIIMRIQIRYNKTFEMLTMFFNDDLKIAIALFFMPFSYDVEGQLAANHRLTGVSQAGLIALFVYPTNCFGSHAQKKRFSGILQRARSFTPKAILDGFELIVVPDLHLGILDLRDHERIARLNLVGRGSHQVAKSGIAWL